MNFSQIPYRLDAYLHIANKCRPMPRINSQFTPAWWLPGPHLQTIWPTFFKKRYNLGIQHERVELEDGDFIDLAWSGPEDGKIVLILHGLEGSLSSHYANGFIHRLNSAGYRSCFMHFRGCSDELNRLPRSYHSGETGDPQTIIRHIEQQHQTRVYATIGVSLGGNVLLKWLGECGEAAPMEKAIAISVPFDLAACAQRLQNGFSRFYQHHLIHRLCHKLKNKCQLMPMDICANKKPLKTFFDFDDRVTAPLHGFRDVADYYSRSSSRQFIASIKIPCLILHAADDPFMVPQAVPDDDQLPACVTLELSAHGGHVGFVGGHIPGRPVYWLEQRIIDWLG